MNASGVVIVLELLELARRIGSVPEEHPVEILMPRMRRSRTERTVPRSSARARLHGLAKLPDITNSPPTPLASPSIIVSASGRSRRCKRLRYSPLLPDPSFDPFVAGVVDVGGIPFLHRIGSPWQSVLLLLPALHPWRGDKLCRFSRRYRLFDPLLLPDPALRAFVVLPGFASLGCPSELDHSIHERR